MECKACGSGVGDRDRYCPACGMPNVDGSRHPRFGPAVELRPLYLEPTPPGPSEVACWRCGRPNDRTHTYCVACGMEMELAVLAADRTDLDGVWPHWGPPGTVPYRSLRGATVALRLALRALAALAMVGIGAMAARYVALESGNPGSEEAQALARWSDRAMWLLAVIGAVVAVGIVGWARRAATNLAALCVRDNRFAPWQMWAGWFVPVANLVLPYAAVEELWRVSGPDGPPVSRVRRPERAPFAVHLWWPCIALGTMVASVARLAMPADAGRDVETWQVVVVLGGIGLLLLIVGTLALAVVLDEVSARQARRADLLGPPKRLRRVGAEPDTADDEVVVTMRDASAGPYGRY